MSLSSPNRMVWELFAALRRSVDRASDSVGSASLSQEVAVSVLLAVAAVETFLNVFFRNEVENDPFLKRKFLEQLNKRAPLAHKVSNWPQQFLGKPVDLTVAAGKAFDELRDLRNRMMHFTSTYDSLDIGGVKITGLSDTAVFDELDDAKAKWALESAERFLIAIFVAKGIPQDQLALCLQQWTGKVS